MNFEELSTRTKQKINKIGSPTELISPFNINTPLNQYLNKKKNYLNQEIDINYP